MVAMVRTEGVKCIKCGNGGCGGSGGGDGEGRNCMDTFVPVYQVWILDPCECNKR